MTEVMQVLPNTFEPDDLVVHLAHLDLILRRLDRQRARPVGEPEVDERLGLALVRLADMGRDGRGRPVTDIDRLLATLRRHFATEYGDWVPLMGKNRHMGIVAGMPQPESMGDDDLMMGGEDLSPVERPPQRPAGHAGRGVRVGVLDTRLYPHPDLTGRFITDRTALYEPPRHKPAPHNAGHATFVSSIILGQAPDAILDVRNVLDGNGTATAWDTVREMVSFADSGIDVLNLSLGCRTVDGQPPLLMSRAVELLSPDVLIVAAAGNHGDVPGVTPTWPAALPDVVAVGARGKDGEPAPFSPRLPWVTCTAPGVEVKGAYLDTAVRMVDGTIEEFKGYARWSGTSFATAKVSGAIAAHMAPGKITARAALNHLLARPDGLVRAYVQMT